MSKTANKIWINGQIHPADTPAFIATDRGALLGDGLFETIKILGGRPCYFDDHWTRLCTSAKYLHLPIPFEKDAVLRGANRLAKTNSIADGAARLTLSRGTGPRGLGLPPHPKPVMMITIADGLPRYEVAPVLGLSQIRRNASAVSCHHKTLSYIDNVAARLHQKSYQCREEVVMLDTDGNLASASVANLFWWDEKALFTPALGGAVLPGTMRARVLAQAQNLSLEIHEGYYPPTALLAAKGAFMTNALIGMQLILGLDFGALGTVRFTSDPASGFMAPLLSMPGGDVDKTSPPV